MRNKKVRNMLEPVIPVILRMALIIVPHDIPI